jgi:hypothetical protein
MLRLIALLVCLSACSTTHVVGQPITVEAVEQLKVEAVHSAVIVDYEAGIAPRRSSGNAPRSEPAQNEQIQSAHNVLTAVILEWMTFGTATDG